MDSVFRSVVADERGSRVAKAAVGVLSIALCLIAVAFAANVPLRFGLPLLTEQGVALILGISLAVIFLRHNWLRAVRCGAVPLYDWLFAILGLGVGIHMFVRYPTLALRFFYHPTETFVVGFVIICLVLEALRRTAGWPLVITVGFFLAYAMLGHHVPGMLQGKPQDFQRLISYLGVDNVAVFGLPLVIVATIVVMFILMGQVLLRSGGSEWFTNLAAAVMGRSRGGSAKIAIVASCLFGSISGNAVSNVASTGVLTIPLMKRAGIRPATAGAFEAVASTGGQLMPPIMGAAGFLMAEILLIPYTQVMIAALVPALLYYLAIFIQADLDAARTGIPPVSDDEIPKLSTVLKDGWFFPLPFVLLIVMLFQFNRSPEEAALWAAVAVLVVTLIFGYKGRRMSLSEVFRAVRSAGESAVDIVVIGAMAGIIIGVLEATGLGFGLTFVLSRFGEGNLALLLLTTAAVCIILGMGMPTAALYLLVATLLAPPLIAVGVEPLAAHLFVLYFGLMSMITPPIAIAAFTAANLAGARPMETSMASIRLGWTAFVVPFMFVMSPNLIMQGQAVDVLLAVVTAVAGVWLSTSGIVGYFLTRLQPVWRLGFLAAGLALLVPAQAFSGAILLEIGGAVLGGLLVIREYLLKRSVRSRSSPGRPIPQ